MNDEFDTSERWGGKGFYIALLLCICVIAVSAWIILAGVPSVDDTAQAENPDTGELVGSVNHVRLDDNETSDVLSPDAPDTVETLATPDPVSTEETEATVPAETAEVMNPADPVILGETEPAEETWNTGVYLWPVVGEIEVEYSMDALTYNVTMSDWRTHDGVDIAAASGTVVKAAAGGRVETIYSDDLYGTTVIIDHGDGLKSCYSNLQEVPAVAEGDRVMAGDTIGAVGRTALCETAEPFHLHFAMALNDKSVDPTDYLPTL